MKDNRLTRSDIPVIVAFLILCISLAAFAAGTCTVTTTDITKDQYVVAWDCTADANAATFPATASPTLKGYLMSLRTTPGTPAPTDQYDITVTKGAGNFDIMRGAAANRSATTKGEIAVPSADPTSYVPYPVYIDNDTITPNISNSAVNSAVLGIKAVIQK